MGVVIESEEWTLSPLSYGFLLLCCFLSVFLLPDGADRSTSKSSSLFDNGPIMPFLSFRRSFLLLYSLATVMQGLGSLSGGYNFVYFGTNREEMVAAWSAGTAFSLPLGTFAGMISDIIGPRRMCIIFYFLHIFIEVLKGVIMQPSMFMTSLLFALASSVFSFCFESWMVNEHEKQGHRLRLLVDNFWLLTLFESSSLLVSQGIANLLIKDANKGLLSPSLLASLLAIISFLYIRKKWNGGQQKSTFDSYRKSFAGHIVSKKSIWILGWTQASVQFSVSVVSVLWVPTIVADGREVQFSRIFPCFLGSRMLGSTFFPWIFSTASPLHKDGDAYLTAAFVVAGMVLSIIAFDYQDIGVLVVLFCTFHACIGLILPSLASLRTSYVPNELRGGMMSLSQAPANAALFFVLISGGYYRRLSNAFIMSFAAVGLLCAAGCIHALRWCRKFPQQSWHEL
ncbi:hypothetical protein HPP92_020944 [Vanilla planifolia]|uniref:Molybdate-anion transporter n=1 Tax=Vanilla planifolia TaxID=51239 RepID=A0A835Q393_VANPL|nr:hypothetical protein HPP92_020944 [Vanilla planifolia]